MFNENNEKLLNLLKDFYTLTHMKVCIFDSYGVEVCFYPNKFTKYCKTLRTNESFNQKCIECDRKALEICKRTKKSYIYTCHAGLTECFSPVVINDEITCYIAIGQIKNNNSNPPQYPQGFNKEELDCYYKELPIESYERINCALRILETCTGYDKLQKYIFDSQVNFKIKITDYITKNLKKNLNIDELCKYMHISRVKLYKESYEIFNKTPADLVKGMRIEYAKTQLISTNKKISVIAEESGIGDYNYFSKIFKKENKISPMEYRKRAVKK